MQLLAMLQNHLLADLSHIYDPSPPGEGYDYDGFNPSSSGLPDWRSFSRKAADSLKASLFKKFEDAPSCDTRAAAVKLFLECNRRCASWKYAHECDWSGTFLGDMQMSLWRILDRGSRGVNFLTLPELMSDRGVGPGVSVGCEDDDFYTKLYASPLTRTSDLLYQLYRCAVDLNPALYAAELHRSAAQGDQLVVGSSLSTVPKTSLIDRTICTEPTLNMFFQKQVGARLTSVLASAYAINLDKQPSVNRRLAHRGSVDGSFATIDLSSASDMVSVELCRTLLPDDVFQWLMATRSPSTRLPDGSEVKLDMISSMGNGFTFPLQTLIFATLVNVAYRILGIKPKDNRTGDPNWGVFGDDIIVTSDSYEFVVHFLELLGFVVNTEKSFSTGCFRESCGGDYFYGYNVRGVYIRHLRDASDVYSAVNRLVRWSARTGIILYETVGCLLSCLQEHELLYVPYDVGDTYGIKTTYAVARPIMDFNRSARYRALVPTKALWRVPSRAFDQPMDWLITSGARVKNYNPQGLSQALLDGSLRNGCFNIRNLGVREAKVRWFVEPNWAFIPAADRKVYGRGCDWEVAAELLTNVKQLRA